MKPLYVLYQEHDSRPHDVSIHGSQAEAEVKLLTTAQEFLGMYDEIESCAVYLFDEFDAFGGRRASKNEVGEIRRVLNSFLQFLEQDDSDSIIVAATNHQGTLSKIRLSDRISAAIARRH